MSDIVLFNTPELGNSATEITALANRVEETRTKVNDTINKINWDVKAKAGVEEEVRLAFMKMRDQTEFLSATAKTVNTISDALNGDFASFFTKLGAIMAAIAGGIKYLEWRNNVTSDYSVKCDENTHSYVYDTVYDDADRAEMEASVTDYSHWGAIESVQTKYDKIKQLRIDAGADPSYKGLCAAFARKQLEVDGLIGKNDPSADGYALAKALAKKGELSTGAKCTGYDSFDDMLRNEKQPVTNIVCSWNQGGIFGDSNGHAMLISRIENGKVYFLDNRSKYRSKDGKYTSPQCLTIEKFKEEYYSKTSPAGVTVVSK